MPPKQNAVNAALMPNPSVNYIQQHKEEFQFDGVELIEGESFKEVEESMASRPYVVFEMESGKLTFTVGEKELVSRKHHVTAFRDYNDARFVTSAYHYTIICQEGEEVRVYCDKNFNFLDVLVKQGNAFIPFLQGEEQSQKQEIYHVCYKFAETIFKHIKSIPDKARAYVDKKMAELSGLSALLTENPNVYYDALIRFSKDLDAIKDTLPAKYYRALSEINQGYIDQVTQVIERRNNRLSLSAHSFGMESKIETPSNDLLVARVSGVKKISSKQWSREQLKMLQEDFLSCEHHLQNAHVSKKIQLLQQQLANIYQQIGYQFDVALSEVAFSLKKKEKIEEYCKVLLFQNSHEFSEENLNDILENLSRDIPVSQVIFFLVKEAVIQDKQGIISLLLRLKWIQIETLDVHLFDDDRLLVASNALRAAFEMKSIHVFQELLEMGVNPDSMTFNGGRHSRCIEAACVQGNPAFLRLLLKHKSSFSTILPGAMGQLPAIHDLHFDNEQLASHYPMMLAARNKKFDCMLVLAEETHQEYQALRCVLYLRDAFLMKAFIECEYNTKDSLGLYFKQVLVMDSQNAYRDSWKTRIQNIQFMPLLCAEIINFCVEKKQSVSLLFPYYVTLFFDRPLLSKVNVDMFLKDTQVNSHEDFNHEECALITLPLIGHLVDFLLALGFCPAGVEQRVVGNKMTVAENYAFDRKNFMKAILRYYRGETISQEAFSFRQFLRELTLPTTCLRTLALSLYTIVFYGQQANYSSEILRQEKPTPFQHSVFLLSALIQMKFIGLLSLGRSAVLYGVSLAEPKEYQKEMINAQMRQSAGVDLSVIDEAMASESSQDVKIGMCQLKLSVMSFFKRDFYKEDAMASISHLQQVLKSTHLKSSYQGDPSRSDKNYWVRESRGLIQFSSGTRNLREQAKGVASIYK